MAPDLKIDAGAAAGTFPGSYFRILQLLKIRLCLKSAVFQHPMSQGIFRVRQWAVRHLDQERTLSNLEEFVQRQDHDLGVQEGPFVPLPPT